MLPIALDAMGGDHAPQTIVAGAVLAGREYGFPISLVGQEARVREELSRHDTAGLKIEVLHTAGIVEMHEAPRKALRQKDSSLFQSIQLVKEGKALAAVSAGNTGAMMACAKIILGVIPGVERPAIATVMPAINGFTLLLDVGANVDCKPSHLLQFAIMGYFYAKDVLRVENPRVGLLNIGEERGKGNDLTKRALELLDTAPINFIGNVEGREIFNGKADVVVCDGFIGNVALKTSESVADTIITLLRREIEGSWRNKLGYLFMRPALKELGRRVDYAEYGGAPLLGVNGACIIGHGSSNAKAIKNALRVAADYSRCGVNQHIEKNLPSAPRPAASDNHTYA